MDDLYRENDFSNNSSDEYEQEQLEIALYSQIHFEENEENYNNNRNNFVIDVQGNEKKGITFDETNANIILTAEIDKKYKSPSDEKVGLSRDKISMKNKTLNNEITIKSSKPESATYSVRKQEKVTVGLETASKEVDKAAKIQAVLRDGPCFTKKTVSAEKLILGSDSDNGSADDDSDKEEVISISDNDDNSDHEKVVLSNSDSDIDSLEVVLGQSDTEAGDLQMNVHSNPRYTYKKMSHDDSGVCNEAEDSDGNFNSSVFSQWK